MVSKRLGLADVKAKREQVESLTKHPREGDSEPTRMGIAVGNELVLNCASPTASQSPAVLVEVRIAVGRYGYARRTQLAG